MKNESENISKILRLLDEAGDKYVSGERISETLGISRAYLWKFMKKIRDYGYDIDAVTHKGYRLISIPDSLRDFEVKKDIRTEIIGKKNIFYFDELASTNDKAYSLADSGEDEGCVVIAERQSLGKGRLGRKWASPAGGVYFSVVLRPSMPIDDIPVINLITANAVVASVKDVCGLDVSVKWPNDVLYNGRKICGILTEMKAQMDRCDFVVIGIGINVNSDTAELPENAISLSNIMSVKVDRIRLLNTLLLELEKRYNTLLAQGFEVLKKECIDNSCLLNEDVRVLRRDGYTEGKAVDISTRGALVIKDTMERTVEIYSGDVELCRKKIQ